MGRPDFRFAGIVAGLMTVAMIWVALDQGLPMRDPDGVAVPTYIRLPLMVLGAVALDIVPRAFARAGRSLRSVPRLVVAVTRERWTLRQAWWSASGLLTWYVCYATFRNLKSYVPFTNDHLWDRQLAAIDRALWLGHEPGDVLHEWFGTGVAAHFFSFVYVAWIVLVPVTLAVALVWTRHQSASSWFVTAVALDWLLGVSTYYLLPTLGPVYSSANHFSDLPNTFVAQLQDTMIDDRMIELAHPTATYPVQSIAAFASLHVGIMVTMCLIVQLIRLPLWVRVSSWVFLVLTVVCTVYLGWHFFTDTLGGAVIGTVAVWVAAWGTGNWVHGRPRLVSRETDDQPSAERIRSA